MKILFGVFDWGLGHATRDTPLIKELIKNNEVHIISTGNALKLLKKTFKKKCKYCNVPSVPNMYALNEFEINFFFRIPFFISNINLNRKRTEKIIKKEKYDLVISDCRYDVFDKKNNSFLINHQLKFNAPIVVSEIGEFWLYKRMRKYKYILVPDFKENNLTGKLSHNLLLVNKKKIKYIGILSHLKKLNLKKDIDIFISLSGPEQTRLDLQKKILSQIKNIKGKIIIAGGNINKNQNKKYENIEFYNFLDKKKQENIMNRAKFLIVRAGYTTIMELTELRKRALLIPSPGQPEQEYLCKYLKKQGLFHYTSQQNLNLKKHIKIAKKYPGINPDWKTQDSVKKFLKIISS